MAEGGLPGDDLQLHGHEHVHQVGVRRLGRGERAARRRRALHRLRRHQPPGLHVRLVAGARGRQGHASSSTRRTSRASTSSSRHKASTSWDHPTTQMTTPNRAWSPGRSRRGSIRSLRGRLAHDAAYVLPALAFLSARPARAAGDDGGALAHELGRHRADQVGRDLELHRARQGSDRRDRDGQRRWS